VPHGHWKTLTLVAALRINGLTAPYVIDGAMDGPSFLAYVEQILAPTLRKGDIVFMDNLRTHKIDGVRQAVEAIGAKVRYLPAYSPDLNPIEMAFSKLKTALRKGAARTVTTLMKLIGKLISKHPVRTARGVIFGSGGLIDVADSGAPIPWQQFVEPLDGMLGNARKDVGEPCLRIDVVELGGYDQSRHDRGTLGTAIGSGEQPGLAAEGKAAQGSFSCVVGQADPAVVDEAGEPIPTLEHIVDRLGDRG